MNISKKIEQIRRQPEHVRMRWVIGSVAVSMFFVFVIWLFSLQLMFNKDAQVKNESNGLSETLKQIKETAPSLKDIPLTSGTNSTENEGVARRDGFQEQMNPELDSEISNPSDPAIQNANN